VRLNPPLIRGGKARRLGLQIAPGKKVPWNAFGIRPLPPPNFLPHHFPNTPIVVRTPMQDEWTWSDTLALAIYNLWTVPRLNLLWRFNPLNEHRPRLVGGWRHVSKADLQRMRRRTRELIESGQIKF
jgi:hypothetical protein